MTRSNYKPIGEFIQRLNIKNSDGKITNLLGINIDKYFMPSVANVIGTDLSKYKIVKKYQFACNRMHVGRDYRLPVAMSDNEEDFIVSPAYDVFEIIDTDVLMPEYLMMWFLRSEFDRNAWFYTDTDVRGKLSWEDFCTMELPVPSIEKQIGIVKEYEAITNRIKLNEELNQKLEETAQAIYKEWFVDFEFPDENGKPYKSSGGKMVYNAELDMEIPDGWEYGKAEQYFNINIGKTPPRENKDCFSNNINDIKWISIADLKGHHYILDTKEKLTLEAIKKYNVKLIPKNTIIMSFKLTVGKIAITTEVMTTNEAIAHFQTEEQYMINYLYYLLQGYNFDDLGSTSSIGNAINSKIVKSMPILIAKKITILKFNRLSSRILDQIKINEKQNFYLLKLKEILLSKMATIGNKEKL